MKNNSKHKCLLAIFALAALLPSSGRCFYNPSTGRWLSRDPAGEAGGACLNALAGNNPVQTVDPTGLCPKECGVKRIAFEPLGSYFPMRPGGWQLISPGADGNILSYNLQYAMQVVVNYLKDDNHDPSACRYVQWVQVTASINGTAIQKSDMGVPADGSLHLDGHWQNPPGWTDDNVEKHLDLFPVPTHTSETYPDYPGLHSVYRGITISYDAVFIAVVKDITRRDTEGNLLTVASANLHLTAAGTIPRLTVSPGTLYQ